jgi:hypothetical protein
MGIDTSGGHPAMDYPQHLDTYATVLRLTRLSIIFLALLLIGMAYFLV